MGGHIIKRKDGGTSSPEKTWSETTKYEDKSRAQEAQEESQKSKDHGESSEFPPKANSKTEPMFLRGKAALANILVKQEESTLKYIFSLYIVMLRISLPYFLLCILTAPVLLSLIFTPIYLSETSPGAIFLEDPQLSSHSSKSSSLEGSLNLNYWMHRLYATRSVRVFLYSLSLSTALGGGDVKPETTFCLLVANLNTLCAQFVFVFVSGAIFQRLSQPMPSVRFAKVALVTEDRLTQAFQKRDAGKEGGGETKKTPKVFLTRLILTGSKSSVLIDAKFEISVKRYVRATEHSANFVLNHVLPLVRSESSYLRYGMLLRHVIDTNSPLWGVSNETLLEQDAIFSVSVLALEEFTMQPVFGTFQYSIFDGDVLFDREYEDLISMDPKNGRFQMDQTKLSKLKPIEEVQDKGNVSEGGEQKFGTVLGGNPNGSPIRVNSADLNPGM